MVLFPVGDVNYTVVSSISTFVLTTFIWHLLNHTQGGKWFFFSWKEICPTIKDTILVRQNQILVGDHQKKRLNFIRVKQRRYYANVKENFTTKVNVVSWLKVDFIFPYCKMIYDKKFPRHNVWTHIGFCRTLANFGWPMTDDRLLSAALTHIFV